VTTRGVTLAALLAAIGRPSWWLLALAGFLVRGGVLLFVLAIVALPSPLVVSNIVAPLVVPLALGQIDDGTLALIEVGVGSVVIWLIGGGLVAAAIEIALIRDGREAMVEEGLAVQAPPRPGRLLTSRVALAHLLVHVPTALVIGIGSVRIANVAYIELTNPSEVVTPLLLRVIAGAAAPVGAIVVIWLLGEIVGGLAARRLVLAGSSLLGSLRGAVGDLVRRPAGALLPALGTTLVLAVDLSALLVATAFVWSQVRESLIVSLIDPLTLTVTLLAFGGTWVGALALTGLIDAWRSAAMTFEAERAVVAGAVRTGSDPDPGGTFGASTGRRPGDWSTGDEGGSL
jgi:hypothetical protein